MAELTTLARPYAKAAFEQALATSALAAWDSALSVAAAVSADAKVAGLLKSPGLTSANKADTLIAVCGDAVTGTVANFIRVLAENKRLPLLPQIHEQFLALKANQERSVDMEVTTAFDLDADQARRLATILGEKLKRVVNVKTRIDKTLIGGVVIRTEDLVIDGSVRGRLAKLSEAMNS